MNEIFKRIAELENEIAALPKGYISKKNISGRERLYLQWNENGKMKSKYIKDSEADSITALVEQRKALQAELKKLKESPDGIKDYNLKRKAGRNMNNLTGNLMSKDKVIAVVKNGVIIDYDEKLIPLYLKRTMDMEGWLASRAIDAHRTNSRLLKRVLRIGTTDDAKTALAVNAATLTDKYWFKPEGSLATYEDVRFKENYFDKLALCGDPNGFSHKPSRTPELTNTGSFEKCWSLIDGEWWMYKSGDKNAFFSELFICNLGKLLGLNIAYYEMDGKYIRTKNFTDGKNVNFEPMASFTDDDGYLNCFNIIYSLSPELAKEYLYIIWFDTVCYNMDRHTQNFGFIRDCESGEILCMAPNYDNNIALISNGMTMDVNRKNDGFIRFFKEFLSSSSIACQMYKKMELPVITEEIVDKALDNTPVDADREYVKAFILNGYEIVNDMIFGQEMAEDMVEEFNLTL